MAFGSDYIFGQMGKTPGYNPMFVWVRGVRDRNTSVKGKSELCGSGESVCIC